MLECKTSVEYVQFDLQNYDTVLKVKSESFFSLSFRFFKKGDFGNGN